MKKLPLLLSTLVVLTPFCLSACQRGIWDDFKTPELFLKKAETDFAHCELSLQSGYENAKDYNFEIKNALMDAAPFTATKQEKSDAERYFVYSNRYYDGFVGLSAPSYVKMYVYDDGFIKIDFNNIKEDKHAYFTMDEAKAKEINNLVNVKLPRDAQIIREDEAQALKDGVIDNFFNEMSKQSSIRVEANEATKDGYYSYHYHDTGELLTAIKEVEHTYTDEIPSYQGVAFKYNYRGLWMYTLYQTADTVKITYHYTNRFDETRHVDLYYRIDLIYGKQLIEKALELADKE